jgi:hypothetical protein
VLRAIVNGGVLSNWFPDDPRRANFLDVFEAAIAPITNWNFPGAIIPADDGFG